MNDRRLTPCNGRVAEAGWESRAHAPLYVAGSWSSVAVPVTDIRARPAGARDRQMLRGERFLVLESLDGWSFGRAERDGYVGYVAEKDLGPDISATHFVSVRATHEYPEPEVKIREIGALSFGTRLAIASELSGYLQTTTGTFVPKCHLRELDRPCEDAVTVAQLFLGTPYLWGGNSSFGIDCSGLVQAALLACGITCPGDSDLQQGLGFAIDEDEAIQRADLFFWNGHVAFAVDGEKLIHANAHDMAVVHEGVEAAIARIAEQGGGPVIARRRI